MYYTVYKITNKINDKIYIGKHQTKTLDDGYMGSGKHLKHSIKKYGLENFTKEILFTFDSESDMNLKEAELVTEEFCDRKDTYNICIGGQGGFGYINSSGKNLYGNNGKLGHELAALTKGRVFHLEKLSSNSFYREEYSKNLSKSLKERYKNHTHQWVGRSHLSETKVKMSSAKKGKGCGKDNANSKSFILNDKTYYTINEACVDLNISYNTFRRRRNRGLYKLTFIQKD